MTVDSVGSAGVRGEATPHVSIIVPTHNRPEALRRLLNSLRNLDYSMGRLELIVVGGQRDVGREVVQDFAESVNFRATYHVVPDEWLTSASFKRNQGARSALGEILAFTDDDCVVQPEWLTEAVSLFRSPGIGAVEGAVHIPKPERPTPTYRGSLRLSLPGGYQTCNMFYRRTVFDECGGFDLSFPYYMEDTDLAYSVMERGYSIPFSASAVVNHPVPPGRPLKLFTIARTVEHMPYLFLKHARSRVRLQATTRLLNRSHYLYLTVYGVGLLVALEDPVHGVIVMGLGLCVVLPVHLLHDFVGLHFTVSELALTALSQPAIPLVRLFYWVKGSMKIWLGRKPLTSVLHKGPM